MPGGASLHRPLPPLPTTVVGSYPQPEWLVDRQALARRGPPRVRAREIWRVAPELLAGAQEDATLLAIRDFERAGIDILTDGEMRRESYSNRFATALDGVDPERIGQAPSRVGRPDRVPLVVGPVRRRGPVEVDDVTFLRANTERTTKITVPGPFTMSQQCQDDHYGDRRALALAYADALNEEVHDLVAAGADVVQLDEPYLQSFLEDARAYALEAIDRALAGVTVPTVLHTCFGYAHFIKDKSGAEGAGLGYPFLEELAATGADQLAIEAAQPRLDLSVLDRLGAKTVVLGVIDLADPAPETAEVVAGRIRAALEHLPPERLVLAPDCGMKYLPRATAYGKLVALVEGAQLVRAEL
ncbi:MAG: 5-methyltetrahydropteroyltriglutamate--homocysteine methyltransferase [Acidimicrobiia bacterium]|nr:5-methyltetrahydropteroyltriglutamate--homocysteine methyltransferase [Acidimicrobiia bacterium]